MEESAKDHEKWHSVTQSLRKSQNLAVAGQFAAAIMHEINNPLEAILNLNYLVQRNSGSPDLVRQYSSLIEEQLGSLIQIARQTLSYCRPTASIEEVAPASVAEAALRVHQKSISDKQIRLNKSFAADVTLQAHPGEMLQVFSNLIANAVDALPANGTLYLRVKRSCRGVQITVADDGPGIPDTIMSRIFEPFFTTKKERGTGLGLAISKAIIESHQGKITGRSSTRAGRSGTVFSIVLPSSSSVAAD